MGYAFYTEFMGLWEKDPEVLTGFHGRISQPIVKRFAMLHKGTVFCYNNKL